MTDENKPIETIGKVESDSIEEADKSAQPNVVILPPETIKEAAAKGTGLRVTIATAHSGPLPSPATLREYEAVVPGLPATIIDEFKKETKHRRRTQTIGSLGAIAIAIAAIILGTILGLVLKSPLVDRI